MTCGDDATTPARSEADVTADTDSRPLVLVTVGSDHHPFDRLIGWVDNWLVDGGAAQVDCVIQYGTASRPRSGRARPYFDHDELQDLMGQATVVVMQGGPIGIKESQQCGRLPVVVPRLRRLNEVVDDHQVTFAKAMAAEGMAMVVESEAELRAALEAALRSPSEFRIVADDGAGVATAVHRFAELVSAMARWDDPSAVRRCRWWPRRASG